MGCYLADEQRDTPPMLLLCQQASQESWFRNISSSLPFSVLRKSVPNCQTLTCHTLHALSSGAKIKYICLVVLGYHVLNLIPLLLSHKVVRQIFRRHNIIFFEKDSGKLIV